jgi:DNA-binding response OmpR family regulator
MLTARRRWSTVSSGSNWAPTTISTKPFHPAELVARVEALLRRVKQEGLPGLRRFAFADVEVDFEKGDVKKGGKPGQSGGQELQLLQYLIEHRGKVVPREELLENVWSISRRYLFADH